MNSTKYEALLDALPQYLRKIEVSIEDFKNPLNELYSLVKELKNEVNTLKKVTSLYDKMRTELLANKEIDDEAFNDVKFKALTTPASLYPQFTKLYELTCELIHAQNEFNQFTEQLEKSDECLTLLLTHALKHQEIASELTLNPSKVENYSVAELEQYFDPSIVSYLEAYRKDPSGKNLIQMKYSLDHEDYLVDKIIETRQEVTQKKEEISNLFKLIKFFLTEIKKF